MVSVSFSSWIIFARCCCCSYLCLTKSLLSFVSSFARTSLSLFSYNVHVILIFLIDGPLVNYFKFSVIACV